MKSINGDDANLCMYAGVLLAVGAWIFAAGWRKLRRKRLLRDVPASKIGSVAMGLCEISGQAGSDLPVTAQLTGRSAVWRRLKISCSSGKSEIVLLDVGSAAPFKIDDGTGWVVVAPKEAQLRLADPVKWLGHYREANDACRALIDRHDSADWFAPGRKSWGSYTIEEWAIETGQTVFVLGCAVPPDGLQGAGCKAVMKPDPREGVLIVSTSAKLRLNREFGSAALAALIGGPLFFLIGLALLLGYRFGW